MLGWLKRDPRREPEIEIEGRILPIAIRRLDRARRMTLRLAPDGSEVRISMPRWTPSEEAVRFAHQRRDWLAGQFAAIPAPGRLAHGVMVPFRDAERRIHHEETAPRRVSLARDTLLVGGPEAALESRLRRWMQGEARALLCADLAHYCERARLSPSPLALSNAQRRWGSCSADGTVRINWRLVMAPDEVRRSVVAHEVAHRLHFDHSPAFHGALAELFEGDLRAANRWLKANGRSLYRWFG
jgi:predicted metal-dependent hydrolase